jgi:hypothetical protein
MEISNLKDDNVKNNAKVSLKAGRLALMLVNIIQSLKKDKEFTKLIENKSLLKKLVLFEYNDEKFMDEVKKFINERIKIIFGKKKQKKAKELLEELNKIKEETKKEIEMSEKVKSIDILLKIYSQTQEENIRQDTAKQIGKLNRDIVTIWPVEEQQSRATKLADPRCSGSSLDTLSE